MSNKRVLFAIVCAFLFLPSILFSSDEPGVPDTVKLTGGPLKVGQSIPLDLTIVNDEVIGGYSLGFLIHCPDTLKSGDSDCPFAVFDSIVYVNRMADPQVLLLRYARYQLTDSAIGMSPDTLAMLATKSMGSSLSSGSTAIAKLYFTGLNDGYLGIDSTFFPPAGDFILVSHMGTNRYPQWHVDDIYIESANPLPQLTVPFDVQNCVVNSPMSFEVSAVSGHPVALTLEKLCGFDDTTRTASNPPQLSAGNPATFSWTPGTDDYGIWKAQFTGTDVNGTSPVNEVIIAVVQSGSYSIAFDLQEIPGVTNSHSFGHGDFDNDSEMEIFLTGTGEYYNPTAELYDRQQDGSWIKSYEEAADNYREGTLHIGYFNDDENLDILCGQVVGVDRILSYLLGQGNHTFLYEQGVSNPGTGYLRGSVMGEYTGDNYLDIAVLCLDTRLFSGQAGLGFSAYTDIIEGYELAVSGADFNDDGLDDLAIGTSYDLLIYMNNGNGDFTNVASYPQAYGSADIEVTNRGSDFNDDDIYDLCISTPSVGLAESQMYVYLGNGDGTFGQSSIRTVLGQIFGNCTGDFNGDGLLDIAFANGARKYVAILFGDGDGAFTNEIRVKIPSFSPNLIDCFDADRDGDLDIAVVSRGYSGDNALYILENQMDPSGFSQGTLSIEACDNAELELISTSGKVFNQIKNTMPSGEYFNRNLDDDTNMDDFAFLNVLEDGEYILKATPRPNAPPNQSFDIDYNLNGFKYRLASNLPMHPNGYSFKFSADEMVWPRSGVFSQNSTPVFSWIGDGQFDFELAGDIDFNSILVSQTVSGGQFTYPGTFNDQDTSAYFWRVKPAGTPDFNGIYVYNYVPADIVGCGDTNSDGYVNVTDAIIIINYVFVGGQAPEPQSSGDTTCDGLVNISDAVWIINFVFNGGKLPCDADGDGSPDC